MDAYFSIFFILFIAVFGFIVFSSIREWAYNNSQPRVATEAIVITKRTNVSVDNSHHNDDSFHHHHQSTTYYVTFELSTGDRKEFTVDGRDYGLVREDDRGTLTFQGNRYLGFERMLVNRW